MMKFMYEEAMVVKAIIDGLDDHISDPDIQMAALCMIFDHIVKISGYSFEEALKRFTKAVKDVNEEFGDVGVM